MKKFTLPPEFLEQLKEFSNQGFCLFIINSEGNIDVLFDVDNEMAALSLIMKMKSIGSTLESQVKSSDAEDYSEE